MPRTMRPRSGALATVALLVALAPPLVPPLAAQEAEAPEIRRYGDTPYLAGGIGVGEREAMEAVARREGFNLKLIFATREGTFMADVPVRITSPDGTLRLEATAEGPWLFTRLPAGEYRVGAEFPSGTRLATVVVPPDGRQQVVLAAP